MSLSSAVYTDRLFSYTTSGSIVTHSDFSLVDPCNNATSTFYLGNNTQKNTGLQPIYICTDLSVNQPSYPNKTFNTELQFHNDVVGQYTGGFVFYQNTQSTYGTGTTIESARINNRKITTGAFNTTSDYRIKEEIEDISPTDLEQFENIHPVSYFIKDSDTLQYGMIAHELQEIYPHLVEGEKDGNTMQSINYIGLIPLLIKTVQDLKKEVALLKSRR